MCGRYALGIRATFVRHQFQQQHMPVDDAPEDDELRETYNFAPGYHGLVYRADTPDYGHRGGGEEDRDGVEPDAADEPSGTQDSKEVKYKLQAMKWGLVPFWTKRNPDYGTVMKTINCRDDSLIENRGMWTSMKRRKRCIVIATGFYEWLKKNDGKEKIPHYTKRKDGKLMCFAGLWDMVQYEGSEDKHYTYTIITTDSNKQLNFLHDRMPVILENGSDDIRTWLDPKRTEWSKELQSLLKPFDGELECYPVSKDVGKAGNNSPSFIIPIASSENKQNIANFFANAKKQNKSSKLEPKAKNESQPTIKAEDEGDDRLTVDKPRSEDNAPIPVPKEEASRVGVKRDREDESPSPKHKAIKTESNTSPIKTSYLKSPEKSPNKRVTRSATSNGTGPKKSPSKSGAGSQKITSFFSQT